MNWMQIQKETTLEEYTGSDAQLVMFTGGRDSTLAARSLMLRGLFIGMFRVFKGGVSLSKVAACS